MYRGCEENVLQGGRKKMGQEIAVVREKVDSDWDWTKGKASRDSVGMRLGARGAVFRR